MPLQRTGLFFSFFFLAILLLAPVSKTWAQQDSCTLRISLLTCSPGEELYSTFGHSAVRVIDPENGTDLVFNFGTFEFGPGFYSKYIRGKLNYFLSIELFSDFMYAYQYEKRSIIEQPLLLDCEERQQLYTALQENSRPENRNYKYDFLFDNCSTRIRDIVARNTKDSLIFKNILPAEAPTFRNLLHTYLNKGGQYWSKMGIDILLGSKLDREVTTEEAMFLPDYLMLGFDSAYAGNKPLVTSHRTILSNPPLQPVSNLANPLIIFILLAVVVLALQYSNNKSAARLLHLFDRLFFFLLGALGIVLLLMWFGTDHEVCSNNLNLVWALPTHFIIAFLLHKKKKWVRKYFQVTLILCLLLAANWFFIPQQLNAAIAPILAIIIARSYYRIKLL